MAQPSQTAFYRDYGQFPPILCKCIRTAQQRHLTCINGCMVTEPLRSMATDWRCIETCISGAVCSCRDQRNNHCKSRSDSGGNGLVERFVADTAIVTGDSRFKKFSEGLRQKASAENIEPSAQYSRNTSPPCAPFPSIKAPSSATTRH